MGVHNIFKYWLVSFLIVGCSGLGLKAQSSEYIIESFQSIYTELSMYESIALLTGGDRLWVYDFNLEFPFPFYDSTYTWVHFDSEVWGSFTIDEDIALLVMHFSKYTFDELVDTSNITSDVRFAHVEIDNKKAFVLQYTNVGFFGDPNAELHDTRMNFQIWLHESGNIEVHFGEMSMDNNPIYEPGIGFYDYTTSGGVDTTYVAGPHMGISHPLDEENAIALDGSYDDYEVSGDQYSILTELPPIGWVIRFKPTMVAVKEPKTFTHFNIAPNPTSDFVILPDQVSRLSIYDMMGRLVFKEENVVGKLDVSSLPKGVYMVNFMIEDGVFIGKVVKE